VKGPVAAADVTSTTELGDWFANAFFWRPHVAMLVNRSTLLPVFVELAPAATLRTRVPVAIERVLRLHGVNEAFITAEVEAMQDVCLAPTDDRSVLGVMNDMAYMAEHAWKERLPDLDALSMRMSTWISGPLAGRGGTPGGALAVVVNGGVPLVAPRTAHRLKISIVDTKPPVWRRVLVDSSQSFRHLHLVVQVAFGWAGYHLHEFEVREVRVGEPDPEEDWREPPQDERRIRINSLTAEGTTFLYTYDFGDDWRHQIEVEAVEAAGPDVALPALIDGRRACPPEDSGGPGGYEELLQVLSDPTHPDHEHYSGWAGDFDPEAFNPAGLESGLHAIEFGY